MRARAVNHLHLRASALRCLAAGFIASRRRNARPELSETRLRANEDEKRCAVSASYVCLIEPEPMATSPTAKEQGIRSRRPSSGFGQLLVGCHVVTQ